MASSRIHVIKMPDIGEGIAEVELAEWHVQPGDSVAEDQVLADVMTDKATVEIPSPVVGKVVSLGGKVGDVLAVGAELIRLEVEAGQGAAHDHGAIASMEAATPAAVEAVPSSAPEQGEPPAKLPNQGSAAPQAMSAVGHDVAAAAAAGASTAAGSRTVQAVASKAGEAPSSQPSSAAAAASGSPRHLSEKPLASPSVRRHARELGVELRDVRGSGPGGRIRHEDVQAHHDAPVPSAAASAYAARDGSVEVPVVGLRRKIAQKMQESKRHIPHFSYVEEVDVTEIEALRARLNAKWGEQRPRLTLLPFLARAMVLAVAEFPQMNARYDDEAGVVTRYEAVHLGVATQTEHGLMVPVLRHAESRGLWANAAEIARLAQAARRGQAVREELSGSTITLTSLGPLGGIVSTPVINYPEVAIVGVNRIVERPVILGGAVVARKMMNLSSSFDHRVVDGLHAAQFVQAIRAYLESPATMFVE
ncbi:dihydrolipoamide acetyltransferase family protein [Candidimonas nitroreducens]|uniref:Dihydrolipoamide acetyltransferase component of pyruvate dehydrogenase complex n=1 Tax=Candidimonas nitroreducens TaxID=683354 RepID=A0A225MWN8_9BURK|nr:dihydrolipoamide acetyltransferase family protein [Candidimonas nitroreducens]OWT65678.1 branched-chain alpha-keto acid dehydrogenase subunit E2 [Candidimonas nitroreducens]